MRHLKANLELRSHKGVAIWSALLIAFAVFGAAWILQSRAAPAPIRAVAGVSEYYASSFRTKGRTLKASATTGNLPYATPLTWPIHGSVTVTNDWGNQVDIIVNGARKKGYHAAIDIAADSGTPVYAADDGIVVGKFDWGNCGMAYLIQRNTNPATFLTYEHLSFDDSANKQEGARIKKDARIGSVGVYGGAGYCGTDTHLHFGVEKQREITTYKAAKTKAIIESRTSNPRSLLPSI